jgi:glycosyltransferase involved in cell wall biosynthesis
MTTSQPRKTGIAIVYWGRLGGGAQLMQEIAQALLSDDRFDVFASPSQQSELPSPLPQERLIPIDTFSGPATLILRTAALPWIVAHLVDRLVAKDVRTIVTIMPHIWGLALQRAARRAGIRTILVVHDADSHPGERRPVFDWLVRQEIRRSDRIVTLSKHVAERLVARGDVRPERLTRLFHPIFHFDAPASAESRPHKPFRLLFFGRILPYKGVALLLEAFARLRTEGVDATLRIVGRGEIAVPAELLRQPGLAVEQGWVPPEGIGSILAWADALVLPYLEASQSGVVAAAYGAGLPVVATPVGGLAEQVIDGVTGALATGTTPEAVADAIRRLVEIPELYQACRAGAIRRAETDVPHRFVRELGDVILATVHT